MQYGQAKTGLTDREWKQAALAVLLFWMFPFAVTVIFVLVVAYVAASNCTGCVKSEPMGRTEFWILMVVNVSLLAVLLNVMHSKGVF